MDKCRFLKTVSSYLDNQLSAQEKERFQAHLDKCAVCARELAQLTRLQKSMSSWKVPEVQGDFERTVRDSIVAHELERGQSKMKKQTLAILVPSGVIAGLLLLVVMGKTFLQYGTSMRSGQIGNEKSSIEYQDNKQYIDQNGYLADREKSRFFDGGIMHRGSGHAGSPVQSAAINGRSDAYGSSGVLNDMVLNGEDSRAGLDVMKSASEYAGKGELDKVRAAGGYRQELKVNEPMESPNGPVIVIQPSLPATGVGDKIIRTAEIRLEVQDGKEAYKKASQICQELGGYLAASNFYKDQEGREAGTITMRIPKDKFLTALDTLSQLGKVEDSHTDSRDVSQEYASVKSHLDAAMVVYTKMLEALQKKQVTISDAIRLESELTPVLKRVEDLKNQLEALNNAVSFTTVNVYFHEPAVSAKVLQYSKQTIAESMLTAKIRAVRSLAGAIPSLFSVFAAVLVAFLVFAGVVALVKAIIGKFIKKD